MFRGEPEYAKDINLLRRARRRGIGSAPITDLSLTQVLPFEITNICNLSTKHCALCPAGDPGRYGTLDTSRPITDDIIVECVKQARDMGFRGELMWHYYNEPFLAWPRLRLLIQRIKQDWPAARFGCFTNGTSFPYDLSELSILDDLWVSNYAQQDWHTLLGPYVKHLRVPDGILDQRMTPMDYDEWRGCLRPFHEVIIDYYGNGHFCCGDWRGEERLGNVWDEGFRHIVDQYLRILNLVRQPIMPNDSPAVCRRCRLRCGRPNDSVPDVSRDAIKYLFGHQS